MRLDFKISVLIIGALTFVALATRPRAARSCDGRCRNSAVVDQVVDEVVGRRMDIASWESWEMAVVGLQGEGRLGL